MEDRWSLEEGEDEEIYLKPEEQLDIVNDVYYDAKTWREEEEIYQGLSREKQELRRYEMGRRGYRITLKHIREELLEKGYIILSENGGVLLAKKEEGEEFSEIKVDYPEGLGVYCQGYDIRITHKRQKGEETWYLKIKTMVVQKLSGNKLCLQEEELQLAEKANEGHYLVVFVFLDTTKEEEFVSFYEPVAYKACNEGEKELLRGLGISTGREDGVCRSFQEVYAAFGNLIWDGRFDGLPKLRFFRYY